MALAIVSKTKDKPAGLKSGRAARSDWAEIAETVSKLGKDEWVKLEIHDSTAQAVKDCNAIRSRKVRVLEDLPGRVRPSLINSRPLIGDDGKPVLNDKGKPVIVGELWLGYEAPEPVKKAPRTRKA